MDIISLETPKETEKHFAPKTDDYEPFYINEFGKTYAGTPCYQLRIDSTLYCIQYVISGSGVIICNNRIYTVSAGDTFLLPAGKDQIYYSNPDNRFERIWINFKGKLADSLIDVYGLKDTVVYKGLNSFDPLEEIQKTCKEISDPEVYKKETAVLFFKLIQFLSENAAPYVNEPKTVEEIRLYLDLNAMNNLSLNDIAKHFSMSKEHIIRVFKKTYNITPHQYILQSKIRMAMIMLKTTEDSIANIAERLSFSDPHHFSEAFKTLVGIRPSIYRKRSQT